jgi:bifunctional ADP-heptose synthase (sugar kinase/adenylyltransferase)
MTSRIPDFTQTKVLVVGGLMLDRCWYADTSRFFPETSVLYEYSVHIICIDGIGNQPIVISGLTKRRSSSVL